MSTFESQKKYVDEKINFTAKSEVKRQIKSKENFNLNVSIKFSPCFIQQRSLLVALTIYNSTVLALMCKIDSVGIN